MTSDQTTATSDAAFRLPALVADDPELAALHTEYVNALRAESAGLPMHTVQQFLLERIATMYTVIRYREINPGDDVAWTARFSKDYTDQWLGMVKEWNKVLSSGHEALRAQVLQESEQIALESLALVEDPETRQKLRRHFKERYAALGY